jgi:hypothetical protein
VEKVQSFYDVHRGPPDLNLQPQRQKALGFFWLHLLVNSADIQAGS